MIGAYYPSESLLAIDGIGSVRGAGPNFAVQTLLGILRAERPGVMASVAPLGVFSEWAKQVGDVDWRDSSSAEELLLYPMSQAEVSRAERNAFGHQLPFVAVLTNAPRRPGDVEEAFDDCPYELVETIAVYAESDPKPVPTAYFLYWAKLREDVDGGRVSLDVVAKRLGGRLVFPLEIQPERPLRPRPVGTLQDALRVQLAVKQATKVPATATSGVIAVSGIGDDRSLWVGLAIAGVAGWIFWRTVRG